MTLVVADAKLVLDQMCYTGTGPQRRLIAQRFRPPLQHLLQPLEIVRTQQWLPSRSPRLPQPFFALAAILLDPAGHRLADHLHSPRDLGLFQAFFFEQTDGFETTLLQRLKIASHSGWISHTRLDASRPAQVTILCGIQ